MKVFRLKADITFMAEDIENAFLRLGEHFSDLADDTHDDFQRSGKLTVGLADDERWNDAGQSEPAREATGNGPPERISG